MARGNSQDKNMQGVCFDKQTYRPHLCRIGRRLQRHGIRKQFFCLPRCSFYSMGTGGSRLLHAAGASSHRSPAWSQQGQHLLLEEARWKFALDHATRCSFTRISP